MREDSQQFLKSNQIMILAATSTQLSGSNQNEIVPDCTGRTAAITQFGDISDIKGFGSEEEQEYNCVYNNNGEVHTLAKLPPEIQLIKHVTREQALYNPKHEFYRNAARKDLKWAEIGAAIGWTELQCKAKWKAFRDQYCRELKRSKTNPKATVKWKYFKYLEFLRPFALSRNYRPRYVPNSNTNGTILSTSADEHKKTVAATSTTTAAIIPSDYGLLQSIKMEPKTQQDDQQHEFVNECVTLTSTMNVAASTTEQTVKNETIVVIAAEQLQHLNDVLQQQQQDQSHQQTQQQHHEENWSFLTSSTDGANNLLTNQQQLTTNYNHNHNSNNLMDTKHIDQTSNSSADYALLRNAIADCVAAAEADASHLSHQSLHQQQQELHTKAQQQGIYVKMFQPPSPTTATTSSDEEDDDPIHKFLNIESYFEKELIAMVQSEDILYNNFHPNYRNAKRKLDVWADIARKMKKTVKQCRLKWKALRDQYIREHKRLRNRKNIETLPRWKHYDALNFLHNFIKHKSENDEKKTLQLKGESVDNSETILKSHVKLEGQQQLRQQQLQLLDLNPTLSGFSTALGDHQSKSQEQQQPHHHSYHEDIKSSISISSSATTTTTTATANETTTTNAQTLVNMDENQSNSGDDYDAIDIDNYINGDRDDNDIVMHENVADDDDDGDDDDDDDNEHQNNDVDVDDVLDNGNESGKSVKNLQNYGHTSVVGGGINGGIVDTAQNRVDSLPSSDFRELKSIVSRVNSPALIPMSNNQQQLRHQTQQHQRNQNDNDHIMQVVSLSCDDVVVLNEANATQFGFVVPSATATATTSTTTTTANALTSTKASLATLQHRDFTEQLVKLNTTVSSTPLSTTNPNVFYNNSNNNGTQSVNTNNNNSNNNDITAAAAAAAAAHDVGCVLSAIATCGDFTTNFDDCATSTIATTSFSSTFTTGVAASASGAATTSLSSSSCSNSSLALSNGTLNAPTATAITTSTSTTNTTTAANGSMCTLPTIMNTIDDDEVGVFFKAIAMKIRSVNLSPIEFTDLQIEVLRVINQSLRKN